MAKTKTNTVSTAKTVPTAAPDTRCKESRPERIQIGDDTWVRNDIQADDEGRSEASLNKEDRLGAPYSYIGHVKYRPAAPKRRGRR